MRTLRLIGRVVPALALACCTRAHVVPPPISQGTAASRSRTESVLAPRSEASTPKPLTPSQASRFEALLCGGRDDCKLEEVIDSGKSRDGAELFVAMVQMPEVMCAGCNAMTSHNVWLLSAVDQKLSVIHRLSETYSAPWSEARIEPLGPGEVRYTTSTRADKAVEPQLGAKHVWGWDYQLDPMKVERTFSGDQVWDYGAFKGFLCSGSVVDDCRILAVMLPSVDWLDPEFPKSTWRTTSLGACSIHFGPVRALLSHEVLYIEVEDASATRPRAMQIELIGPAGFPDYAPTWTLGMDGSLKVTGIGPSQPDREPTPPAHVDMEVVSPSVRRFKLTHVWIHMWTMGIRMTYGEHRSTVETPSGEIGAYSPTHVVNEDEGACEAKGGELTVYRKPPRSDRWAEITQ
jgi:hypothetical protein